MPLTIDRTSEAELATLFDTAFINSLTQYLGIDPLTPSEDMPLSITELLEEAISTTEQEQWRFILPKEVSILLPVEAFMACDKMLFLPLGVASEVVINYTDTNGDAQTFDDFTQYAGEPIRLWSDNWSDLTDDCFDENYPITAVYTPGYTSYSEIPKSTIRALKILTVHNFEYRGTDAPIPKAFRHNCDLAWLRNERANRYIIDDWNKVSPR
jgi:hypothetical protein